MSTTWESCAKMLNDFFFSFKDIDNKDRKQFSAIRECFLKKKHKTKLEVVTLKTGELSFWTALPYLRVRRDLRSQPAVLCANVLSHVLLFTTLWTVANHAPLFMDFPGKNTGVGCHFLLQGIFKKSAVVLRCMYHSGRSCHWLNKKKLNLLLFKNCSSVNP